jgi:hypothetical protein
MVLESILKAGFARKHPVAMMINSFVLCTVGIFASLQVFPNEASVLGIAFVTMAILPVLYSIFQKEEKEEEIHPGTPLTFIERHFDIIKVYSWFFIGLILCYSFWYYYLPAPQKNLAFREQEATWEQINGLRGKVTDFSGFASATGSLATACKSKDVFGLAVDCIFYNNAMVLLWAIIFSFAYGVGAIFLIAWNASVIGLVIGKELLATDLIGAGVRAVGLLPHGIPEIVAYFIGAIAGGIISVGMTRRKYKKNAFENCLKDSAVLVITAFLMLFAASLIEAYLILNAGSH